MSLDDVLADVMAPRGWMTVPDVCHELGRRLAFTPAEGEVRRRLNALHRECRVGRQQRGRWTIYRWFG